MIRAIIILIVGFLTSAAIIGSFGWMGGPTVLLLALIWIGVAVWDNRRRTRSAAIPRASTSAVQRR